MNMCFSNLCLIGFQINCMTVKWISIALNNREAFENNKLPLQHKM